MTKETTLPQEFDDVKDGYSKLPFEVLKDTYTSFLGGAMKDIDRQEVINEINNMSKYSYGMEEPPAVSPRLMTNMPRGIRGLRIADAPSSRYVSHDRFNSGGRGGGRGGFGGGRGGRRPMDKFQEMEYMSRDDNRRSRPLPSSF